MRRIALLLVLLILLPARGWTGDVMAVRMAAGAAQAVAHQAMPDECHEHHGGHHAAMPEAEASAQADACGTCHVCQICHTPALAPALPILLAGSAPVPPQAVDQGHTSAERAPGFKPPIS